MKIRRLNESRSKDDILDLIDDCFVDITDMNCVLSSFINDDIIKIEIEDINRLENSVAYINDHLKILSEFRDSSIRISSMLGYRIDQIFLRSSTKFVLTMKPTDPILDKSEKTMSLEDIIDGIDDFQDSLIVVNKESSFMVSKINIEKDSILFYKDNEDDLLTFYHIIDFYNISRNGGRNPHPNLISIDSTTNPKDILNIPCFFKNGKRNLSIVGVDRLLNLNKSIINSVLRQYTGEDIPPDEIKNYDIQVLIVK